MLREIWDAREGRIGWSYLWSPYWGQRIPVPRLLFRLSAAYLHFATLPFTLVSLTAQALMILAMVLLLRRLFRGHGELFWLSAIALGHLLLSSLQMEVFVEAIGVQYTIGYASGVGAIVLLGIRPGGGPGEGRYFWMAVALAAISSGCLVIGLVVWPILIVEALVLLLPARRLTEIAATGVVLALAYAVGYVRPDMGMGAGGALRHPLQALWVTCLVLGGPISLYSHWLGVACGAIGTVAALGLSVHFVRVRCLTPARLGLLLIVAFVLASAASVALGRISPEWLNSRGSNPPLPSRYLVPPFIFWAALLPICLACPSAGRFTRLAAACVLAIVLGLTVGAWKWQWWMPRAWAISSQDYDAIGSGFIMSVSDQERMGRIFPDEELRTSLVAYMRQEHLSVFAEARSRWPGKALAAVAAPGSSHNCAGSAADTAPVPGQPSAYRAGGTLTVDGERPSRALDVVFADDAGVIVGLGRTLPAKSELEREAEFFGYSRGNPAGLQVFVILENGYSCRVRMSSRFQP